jgi:large subunit ribosomal protein L21
MFAVIKASGRQWTVKEGDVISVNRMASKKAGDKVVFDEVVFVGGSKVAIGAPFVKGAKVDATVTEHAAGEKIRIIKYKRRKGYKKTLGHRQALTTVKIGQISL